MAPTDKTGPAAEPVTASMPWLARLFEAPSADALSAALAARHPAFAPALPRRLAILGAADEGQRLAGLCQELGIDVAAIADDHPERQDLSLAGVTVAPFASLAALDRDVPVIIASHRTLGAFNRLTAMGFAHVAPFALLQVLYPVRFPPHMFHQRLLEDLWEGRERLASLAERLIDDRSRRVLDAVIGYRLTLDPRVMESEVDADPYGPHSLLNFGDDEVYVDGGAFDGDTVRNFIGQVGGRFERALAFEPDPKTFPRLAANFASDPRVQPVNSGLSDRGGVLRFDDAGSRGSMLTTSGGVEVSVVGLDEILGGDRVTYIKMNIEGAELAALEGAHAAITRWKPKLGLAVYHRASDLYRIPEAVQAIEPSYRLCMRQHDGGIIETVLYALPVPDGERAP